MDNSPYTPPEADLSIDRAILEPTYSSLNFWRKLYLIFVWLATIGIVSVLLLAAAEPDADIRVMVTILAIAIIGFSVWSHWAIVNRRIGHLTAIAILNLFPGANLIGCLIMFSIRRVSVKEHESYDIRRA